jgi:hypothetical protein
MSTALAVDVGEFSGATPAAVETDHDLVELALVLPRWQVDALAATARRRGITAGQALRQLIRRYCAGQQLDR